MTDDGSMYSVDKDPFDPHNDLAAILTTGIVAKIINIKYLDPVIGSGHDDGEYLTNVTVSYIFYIILYNSVSYDSEEKFYNIIYR